MRIRTLLILIKFTSKRVRDIVRGSKLRLIRGFLAMKLAIGNDHAAYDMKLEIKSYLESKGHEVVDFGTHSTQSCNYPEFGYRAAKKVVSGEADGGILICGTGVGISLTANKLNGIRCCVCSEPYSAKLSKQHNNTNMIAFGARVVGPDLAKMIVDAWLEAEFQGGRHQTRVDMIMEVQDTQSLKAVEE
jgi:ribose 5-phosphate isomerase B